MKQILLLVFPAFVAFTLSGQVLRENQEDSIKSLDPIELRAVRAGVNAPFAKTTLVRTEIEKLNLGQDIPFLLQFTPSVVAYSDAGNGIGYTGIRIRGTDATRINVTLNGIPYNDAESQGSFFVDLPDFASSLNSIQVQRGVGTSSNGAGAFGATINMSTNEVRQKAYAEINNTYGSFNTLKNTLQLGSGLIDGKFTADLRLSNISSDGYVDRASSSLKAFYFSTAWINKSSSLRFNIFSGKEKTYQAWYGVSELHLKENRTINYAGMERPGEPYDNETDNYKQDHYQLFYNHTINEKLEFNVAMFYTKGKGYYEQYKSGAAYSDYGMLNVMNGGDTIYSTDLVRQLWLDNDFYGNIFGIHYKTKASQLTIGGGWNRYDGKHFGEVTWAEQGLPEIGNWYENDANKTDFNIYVKEQFTIANNLNLFAELQFRRIHYNIYGFRDNPQLDVSNKYSFFNPRMGISYNSNGWLGYFSFSKAGKEPNRDDFEAGALQRPVPEHLNDFEIGFEKKAGRYNLAAALYYMNYRNQLVLTGKINDVGAYTRTNIPESFRMGVELQGTLRPVNWFNGFFNLTLSCNRIKDFTEFVDDYDAGGQKTYNHSSTTIAFSPTITSAAGLTFLPTKNSELTILNKYVGKQYLDNTENEKRKLDGFFVQDVRASYSVRKGLLKEMKIVLQVNNVFNVLYEPNGYTYSYIYGGELVTENFYFPMAGTNFLFGLNLKF